MKIKGISYWKEDMKLTRPYAVTYVMHDSVSNIFIRIDGSNGHYGLGAGSPSEYVTGEIMDEDCNERVPELQELLVGREIEEFQDVIFIASIKYRKQPALLAAIDMALHDLFCKTFGISLGKFLGIRHEPIPTSITIGLKNVEETVEEGLEYKQKEFQIIKLKIGQSKDEDIARCVKLREAVGTDMLIRVDANQGYDVAEFEDFVNKTNDANLEFYEQPMKPEKVNDMLKLREKTREICAADESLHKTADALSLLKLGRPFGIFNIKLMKCGGPTEARQIAGIAYNESIDLMWGCMDESVISISASLNTAMSCPATRYLDLDGSFDLASDVAKGGFLLQKGVLIPQFDKPGLGVELL